MRTVLMSALALSVMLAACGESGGDEAATIEGWKQELLRADEEFSATIASEGLSRWGSFFTTDGAVIRQGIGEIRGVEAVQASMDEGAAAVLDFRWFPERAEVAASGDLGYTVGRSRVLLMGPDSVEMVTTGMYVSIWRRQATGEWKVEMDLGNPLTEPTPVSENEPGTGVPMP